MLQYILYPASSSTKESETRVKKKKTKRDIKLWHAGNPTLHQCPSSCGRAIPCLSDDLLHQAIHSAISFAGPFTQSQHTTVNTSKPNTSNLCTEAAVHHVLQSENIQMVMRKMKPKRCAHQRIRVMACPSCCLEGDWQIKAGAVSYYVSVVSPS